MTQNKKRTAVMGAGVLAGGLALAGGSAVLLGAGQASADPAPAPAAKAAPAVVTAPSADDQALDAYFAAGYDYDDAVALAKIWNSGDPFATKVEGGKKLEAGETLPIAPGSASAAPAQADPEGDAVSTFFAKGYDYDDAVKLAAIWHTANPYEAKVEGGKQLEAGETLPVQP